MTYYFTCKQTSSLQLIFDLYGYYDSWSLLKNAWWVWALSTSTSNFTMCSCFKYTIRCHELFCLGRFPPQFCSRNLKLIDMSQLGGKFKTSFSETQRNPSLSQAEISRKGEPFLQTETEMEKKPPPMLTEVLPLPEGGLRSATRWEITQFLVLGFLTSLFK